LFDFDGANDKSSLILSNIEKEKEKNKENAEKNIDLIPTVIVQPNISHKRQEMAH
jgi:hypothetical protein